MVFPLEVLIGLIHSWNKSGKDSGRTQQQLKSLRIEDEKALVILQWRRRWSTVSLSAQQRGQALTTTMFRRRRLSIVRIFFRRASHAKAVTLGGALIFQRECQNPEGAESINKVEKREETEKMPSREGAQSLLSCLSPEAFVLLSTSKRLNR